MKNENIVSYSLAELQKIWAKNKDSLPKAHDLSAEEVELNASHDNDTAMFYASFFLKPDELSILSNNHNKDLYGHFRTAIESYIHSPLN